MVALLAPLETARAGAPTESEASGDVVFVEGFRLLLVIAGAVAGLEIGNQVGKNSAAPVVGVFLGAFIAYVVGGVVGRLLDRGMKEAVVEMRRMPAGEVFAASVVGTTGLLIGLVAGLPLIALVHSSVDYPIVAVVAWVLCFAGIRLGVAKGRDLIRAAGVAHLLDPPAAPPSAALLVDTSVVLDRYLMVLGRSGLLAAGLVIPRFIVDEVQTLAEGPDPVTSRRARRGLEALEALRAAGVEVRVVEEEVPEVDGTAAKMLIVARRLGLRLATCSADQVERAVLDDVTVLDLRRLTAELTPDHPPGERLVVDLIRSGRQPRQAIGYLPDGDMVVVNDASHLVGSDGVPVVVSSTRQTSQGLLVFAHLAHDGGLAVSPVASQTR